MLPTLDERVAAAGAHDDDGDPSVFGTGMQGMPHTDVSAVLFFGRDFAGWKRCRTVVEYDVNNLTADQTDVVRTYYPYWLCLNERDNDDTCWMHEFGTDEEAIKRAQTKRNRQATAAHARAVKAAKRDT